MACCDRGRIQSALITTFAAAFGASFVYALAPAALRSSWAISLTSAVNGERTAQLEARIENLTALLDEKDHKAAEHEAKLRQVIKLLRKEREEEFEDHGDDGDEEEDGEGGTDEEDEEDDNKANATEEGAATSTPSGSSTRLNAQAAAAPAPAPPPQKPPPQGAQQVPQQELASSHAAAKLSNGTGGHDGEHKVTAAAAAKGPPSTRSAAKVIFVNSKNDPVFRFRGRALPDCPWNCVVAAEKEEYRKADAVVWEGLRMGGPIRNPDAHRKKNGQIWLFRFFFESAFYGKKKVKPPAIDKMASGIDYTMTYKGGSDFFQPFFWTVPIGEDSGPDPLTKDAVAGRNWAVGRKKLLLGIVSNCIGPRIKFWHAMVDLLPKGKADLFGKCGARPMCAARKDTDPCWKEVFFTYKFYFSGENNRCDGYITEKFMRPLRDGMVPVVLGGHGRKDYERIAPGNAFIHVDDFPSMQALVDHLLKVDKDDNLYNAYFSWRKKYKIGRTEAQARAYCKLCEQLHAGDHPPMPVRSYGPSLEKWFYGDACIKYEPRWSQELPPVRTEPRCQPGRPCE